LPEEYARPAVSDPYTVLNAQVTYRFKRFDLYAGCENIFDFRQLRPIIGWQDPFGPYFDTSSVWGPTIGREGYVGVRWRW
jgi:outer membrane receptor protein involved in Fe transport